MEVILSNLFHEISNWQQKQAPSTEEISFIDAAIDVYWRHQMSIYISWQQEQYLSKDWH